MSENPAGLATHEVLTNAKEKFTRNEPLTDVERVLLSEYVIACRARANELRLKKNHQILSKEDNLKLEALEGEIYTYGYFGEASS